MFEDEYDLFDTDNGILFLEVALDEWGLAVGFLYYDHDEYLESTVWFTDIYHVK